ncbi:MAG: RDD family protein [Pseudomonadota bacterium]
MSEEHPSSESSALSENQVPASRWQRGLAASVDMLIIMIIIIPIMYLTGMFDEAAKGVSPSTAFNLLIEAFYLGVFAFLNGKLLVKTGQTIGKRIIGIKIVDLNGQVPTLKQHLLKRYAVYFLPGQIPVVGYIFPIINLLFIFGEEKRCIHDYVAGTRVVQV